MPSLFMSPFRRPPYGPSALCRYTLDFNSNNIRVVTIEGEPWFVLADVRAVLDLSRGGSSYENLSEEEVKTLKKGGGISPHLYPLFKGTSSSVVLVSESGLYRLIMRSTKPQARPFQDWVTREVLPSIRKTGAYVEGQPSLVENPQMDPPGRPLLRAGAPG